MKRLTLIQKAQILVFLVLAWVIHARQFSTVYYIPFASQSMFPIGASEITSQYQVKKPLTDTKLSDVKKLISLSNAEPCRLNNYGVRLLVKKGFQKIVVIDSDGCCYYNMQTKKVRGDFELHFVTAVLDSSGAEGSIK
jgi:hypothetical protein